MERVPPMEDGHTVLRVPWFAQQDQSYMCLPYSLWMVLQFYRNHTNPIIRSKVPDLDTDEIAKICRTHPMLGTRVDDQLIADLKKKIPGLDFRLVVNATFEEIERSIKGQSPCIIIYDCGYLVHNVESNVGHAGVVIGINRSELFLNNPWLGAEVAVGKGQMGDCWDIEDNRLILITLAAQTRLTDMEMLDENAGNPTQ